MPALSLPYWSAATAAPSGISAAMVRAINVFDVFMISPCDGRLNRWFERRRRAKFLFGVVPRQGELAIHVPSYICAAEGAQAGNKTAPVAAARQLRWRATAIGDDAR
jgi:hypothetical protein